RIGFVSLADYGVLPGLLKAFKSAEPRVRLALREMLSPEQAAALAAGELDFGLLLPPVAGAARLEHLVVQRERFVVALPAKHRLAGDRGPLGVRWYGLMYLLGFGAAWWLGIRRIERGRAPVNRTQFDDLVFLAVLGVILGGRLGYVLFYKPAHYASHPMEIFAVWQGGMSFHGGLLGVMLAMSFAAWRHRLDYLRLMDFVAPLVPLGIAAGRLGNFITGALW